MGAAPTKAGEITSAQSIIYQRIIDPNDITKVAQISLIDTGNVMPDGTKIYALDVSGSTLSIIAAGVLKPDGYSEETITPVGVPTNLSPTTQALSVVLQANNENSGEMTVLNITLTAGETIIIETVPDASWVVIYGTGTDKIDVTVMENSTI